MPRKNKELEKEYNKNYHKSHKEEIVARHKKNSQLTGNTKKKSTALKSWRESHKYEIQEYQRKWRKEHNNPEENRKQWLRRAYGLSTQEYEDMLVSQGHVCAICGNSRNGKYLPVDHKHVPDYETMLPEQKRKHIRGILCSDCNKALGLVKDRVSILERMIQYLKDYDE